MKSDDVGAVQRLLTSDSDLASNCTLNGNLTILHLAAQHGKCNRKLVFHFCHPTLWLFIANLFTLAYYVFCHRAGNIYPHFTPILDNNTPHGLIEKSALRKTKIDLPGMRTIYTIPDGRFNVRMLSYHYWNFHYNDQTASRPFHLYIGNPYIHIRCICTLKGGGGVFIKQALAVWLRIRLNYRRKWLFISMASCKTAVSPVRKPSI